MDRINYHAKAEALGWGLADASLDAIEDKEPKKLMICSGEPWCFKRGKEASTEMSDGCVVCDTYIIDPDGSFMKITGIKGMFGKH